MLAQPFWRFAPEKILFVLCFVTLLGLNQFVPTRHISQYTKTFLILSSLALSKVDKQ